MKRGTRASKTAEKSLNAQDAASPVTNNPGEDKFWERAEAGTEPPNGPKDGLRLTPAAVFGSSGSSPVRQIVAEDEFYQRCEAASSERPMPIINRSVLALCFAEWDRRYRENPEGFVNEATRLLFGNPATYGEACADYILELIQDLAPEKAL